MQKIQSVIINNYQIVAALIVSMSYIDSKTNYVIYIWFEMILTNGSIGSVQSSAVKGGM